MNTTARDALLPCPLGCKDTPLSTSDGHKAFCPRCGCSAPINSWNRRAAQSVSLKTLCEALVDWKMDEKMLPDDFARALGIEVTL